MVTFEKLKIFYSVDINIGRQSKVVQALSTLPPGTKLRLEHLTFRQPPRPSFFEADVMKMILRITSVKVIWNVFECGYSSAIDEGLVLLHKLENVKQIHLEMTMLNMLYMIQLGAKMEAIADRITR